MKSSVERTQLRRLDNGGNGVSRWQWCGLINKTIRQPWRRKVLNSHAKRDEDRQWTSRQWPYIGNIVCGSSLNDLILIDRDHFTELKIYALTTFGWFKDQKLHLLPITYSAWIRLCGYDRKEFEKVFRLSARTSNWTLIKPLHPD